MQRGSPFVLEVSPKLPRGLERLAELADNLWYSWDRNAREIFARVHPRFWDTVGHSPKPFLMHVDEQHLVRAAQDPGFMADYARVLAAYDAYHADVAMRQRPPSWQDTDLVAYFCAEFGLHESLPIYSGGLGILAGDHCKAASDMRLPFVGIGLLYRQGYFAQTIDAAGNQIVSYTDSDFACLPIRIVKVGDAELRINVELAGRDVKVRVWHARAGHVSLYFLDTDVAENQEQDCNITHRLYGGDRRTRLEQEIVLGIGGARVLAALGLRPTVWHLNEGHPAFVILERVRNLVREGADFGAALEAVAGNLLFTTHTAVPAGHDRFDGSMMAEYFSGYCSEVGIDMGRLLALGQPAEGEGFDMTSLAVRGSRFQNAVSRIHADVTAHMLAKLWPQVPPDENPIQYVTNAVHAPTFLAPEWVDVFEQHLGAGWSGRLDDPETIARMIELPDQVFWTVHQKLKSHMLHLLRHRVRLAHFRNQGSERQLARRLRHTNPDDPGVLTIGFARRFATYKRGNLLFNNVERLRAILSDSTRPVLFVFAGKAHPADGPGQEVIREIARMARDPEFEDKILLLEGYDLHLARRLVTGVDVWLNTPIYGAEASGTSGMKAGMNGVLNLSILDGWWGEGYQRGNGWAITHAAQGVDQGTRDREDARALHDVLQEEVIPTYYARGEGGYSPEWVRMAKQSIATLLPSFNASRMLGDYARKFYFPAAAQSGRAAGAGLEVSRQLAEWKARVRAAWPGVALRRTDRTEAHTLYGDALQFEVEVQLAGLAPDDLVVELLLERASPNDGAREQARARFSPVGGVTAEGAQRYALSTTPPFCGQIECHIRAYPTHSLLTHPFELGLMAWA